MDDAKMCPEFAEHLKAVDKQYGGHFKNEEELRYFAGIPIPDEQRRILFQLMKAYTATEKNHKLVMQELITKRTTQ